MAWYLTVPSVGAVIGRTRVGLPIETGSLAMAFAKALLRFEESGVVPISASYSEERKEHEEHVSCDQDCEIRLKDGTMYFLEWFPY